MINDLKELKFYKKADLMTKKRSIKIDWLTAFAVSFVLINIICFFYYRDPGGSNRETGAVSYIVERGRYWINFEEGYGVNKADRNGYINDNSNLSDKYILILGNSQTQGINVFSSQRYPKLLNDKLHIANNNSSRVYSVAQGGADFCKLAQGVTALIKEFPQAEMIIIQVIDGRVVLDDLECIYNQRTFDEVDRAEYIFDNEGIFRRIKHWVKDYIPILGFATGARMKNALNEIKSVSNNRNASVVNNNEQIDVHILSSKLTDALNFLNECVNVPIVIINLNTVRINKEDGSLCVNTNNSSMWKEACNDAGITYVDMGEDWIELYEEEHKLPYGFTNTRPGYGHLNPDGHRKIAEKLYSVLKQEGLIQ